MFGFHLIWHELGHDILNLDHTCNETPNFLNHYSSCKEGSDIYLQYTSSMLWFTDDNNPETSQDNKGFHRAVSNYYKLINQNPFTIKYTSSSHGDILCLYHPQQHLLGNRRLRHFGRLERIVMLTIGVILKKE